MFDLDLGIDSDLEIEIDFDLGLETDSVLEFFLNPEP